MVFTLFGCALLGVDSLRGGPAVGNRIHQQITFCPKMMILPGARRLIPYVGVCHANDPKKRQPVPDLTTSHRGNSPSPNPLCDIPSGCCFFTGPWTVTHSSLCVLRRVAAFYRPLRPMFLLVSFSRQWSPVVCALGLCWLLRGLFYVLRSSTTCPTAFPCACGPTLPPRHPGSWWSTMCLRATLACAWPPR